MPNKRSHKTKREIKEAFISLLEKKPINKITVAEVVSLAEISRATFYLHYDDIYRVYDSIKYDILDDFDDIFKNTKDGTSREKLVIRIQESVEYIDINKNLLGTLIKRGDLITTIHDAAVNLFLNEFYPHNKTSYGIIEVNFVTWGLLGTLQDWVSNPNDITKEQFTNILLHILFRFVSEEQ